MNYFDLVEMKSVDRALTSRLGYKKILNLGTDVIVASDLKFDRNKKVIVKSSDKGVLSRALTERRVIGIIIEDNELVKKILDEAKEDSKIVFLVASELTSENRERRLRVWYRARNLFKFAKNIGTKISLVTLAKDKNYLLSANQMMEISKFVGADLAYSKEMLGFLGGAL